MSAVAANLRVLRHSTVCAFADYAGMFSWQTWWTAYLGRMVMQVLFFAVIGLLIDDPATVRYLLIGNAVILATHEAANVIASSTWERRAGTLSLLVSSPTNPLVVFGGRCLQLIATGVALATISFVVVTAIFRVGLPWPQALLIPALIATVAIATSTFALLIGAYVFRFIELRLIAINLTYLLFMAFCGVNVPIDFWPAWLQTAVAFLPVTHGLQAVRVLLDGGAASEILRLAGLELAVAALWLIPAVVGIRYLVDGGRRRGTIDFSA